MQAESFITTITLVVGLLFLASVSAVIAHRIRFPYTIGLVLVGVLIAFAADYLPEASHALEAFKLQPVMIMFLFIPILIFESAYSMKVRHLRENIVPVLMLAAPGLLLSTGLIGLGIWALTPLPLESALVFGCLISATDPVAVIALFKEVGAPKRLTVLMEGESVFNDATAIVTFQIILAVIATGILDAQTITGGFVDFGVVFLGGLFVGLVIGWVVVQAIPLVGDQPLVHITLTLVAAYGAFIIADHYLHASGVMAVLAAGLTIGFYAPSRHRARVHEYLEMFWEDAAFVANSLIFLMLGLSEKVFLVHAGKNPSGLLYPVLIAIAVVLVARFAVVFSFVPLLNRFAGTAVSRGYQVVLAWGGLRGAIAIALAMSLPSHFPYRWQIIDFTFAVVLFTLLVNGTTMKRLMDWLGVTAPEAGELYLEAVARRDAERAALASVTQAVDEGPRDAVQQRYLDDLEVRVARAEAGVADALAALGEDYEARRALLWTACLAQARRIWVEREQTGLLPAGMSERLNELFVKPAKGADMAALGAQVSLPSDRFTLGMILRRFGLARPQARRRAAEASAIATSASAVLSDVCEIGHAIGASAQDIAGARAFYTARRDAAEQLYAEACSSDGDARARIERRLLEYRAQDARRDRLADMATHGAVPDAMAARVSKLLDEEDKS